MANSAKTVARQQAAATSHSGGGIFSKDWLHSDNFFKRAFAVWAHNAVAGFLVGFILMAIFMLMAATFAGGIVGLMSDHDRDNYNKYGERNYDDFDRFDDMDLPPPPADVMVP